MRDSTVQDMPQHIVDIAPGASHLTAYLTFDEQLSIARGCLDLGSREAGFYTPVVRGGLGISTPHVGSTFRNVHQEQYQRGGFAWQLGAGVEYHLWQFVYGVADGRITRVTEKHLRAAGAEIQGSFFTRHVDFGVALRLPE